MEIRWIKASDSFVIGRDELADIVDWAENIYLHHSSSYSEEDMFILKDKLDMVNKALLSYINVERKHHKIKTVK